MAASPCRASILRDARKSALLRMRSKVFRTFSTRTDRGKAARETLVKSSVFAIALGLSVIAGVPARADGPGDPTAVKSADGEYFDKDGSPTYKIQGDGTVDWSPYSGYRRYHPESHVCHVPHGEGSSYAPALKNSLKRLGQSHCPGILAGCGE